MDLDAWCWCEKGCPLYLFLPAWHPFIELGIIHIGDRYRMEIGINPFETGNSHVVLLESCQSLKSVLGRSKLVWPEIGCPAIVAASWPFIFPALSEQSS